MASGTAIYICMSCWAKAGVFDVLAEQLQRLRLKHVSIQLVSLDSTIVKVHPDGMGAPRKNGPQSIGKSCGAWSTKLHLAVASGRDVLIGAWRPARRAMPRKGAS